MRSQAKGVIRICGLGVHPPGETTLETLAALEACRVVLTDLQGEALLSWLGRYCRALVPNASCAAVLAEARRGGEVGLAVWGHPQFSSALAREVELKARRQGLSYSTLAAISPVGSAFAHSVSFLGGDYGYQGIQAYDAAVLLDDPEVLSERLPVVVYAQAATAAQWGRLAKLLESRYPAGHRARLYRGGSDVEIAVSRLAEAAGPQTVVLVEPVRRPA